MRAKERRQEILSQLQSADVAITANQLAQTYHVSRQVIVGDIALLRAADYDIIATNQGYIIPKTTVSMMDSLYTSKLVCFHSAEQTREELEIIIHLGGKVLDVQVDHPVYGILSASLKISSQQDVDQFMLQMQEFHGELLSSLTNGIHIHTIQTQDKSQFDLIAQSLKDKGILYE